MKTKDGFASRLKQAVQHAGVEDTQEALGRLFGVSSVMIWSYRTGEKLPRMSTALRIAEALGVNVNWLLTGSGTMTNTANVEEAPALHGQVPLISWIQAGDFCEAADTLHPDEAEQWLPCPVNHGARTYALRVRGASMQPRFNDGDIIMVDPDGSADHGRFVVAKKMDDHELSFKQLICESGHTYLKALNPNWPEPIIRLNQEWHVCGVVICKVEVL